MAKRCSSSLEEVLVTRQPGDYPDPNPNPNPNSNPNPDPDPNPTPPLPLPLTLTLTLTLTLEEVLVTRQPSENGVSSRTWSAMESTVTCSKGL